MLLYKIGLIVPISYLSRTIMTASSKALFIYSLLKSIDLSLLNKVSSGTKISIVIDFIYDFLLDL
ncbi:hypothetical protein LZ906_016170 (plasmid) [Paraclostridium ghonii]|uniref:hypothetical protein n=1 Tax=Paraclostridium ghonii TaxID=29358 RepID=UPI003062D7AB|nr:hypothetical protein [Paeniclostridium ghonii]